VKLELQSSIKAGTYARILNSFLSLWYVKPQYNYLYCGETSCGLYRHSTVFISASHFSSTLVPMQKEYYEPVVTYTIMIKGFIIGLIIYNPILDRSSCNFIFISSHLHVHGCFLWLVFRNRCRLFTLKTGSWYSESSIRSGF
jgi:hypothetical protein